MVFRFLLSNIFFLINITIGICQIIQINPAFPTVNDVITLHYDATQGNGGLVGVSPVYTHTGVITQNGLQTHGLMFRVLGVRLTLMS